METGSGLDIPRALGVRESGESGFSVCLETDNRDGCPHFGVNSAPKLGTLNVRMKAGSRGSRGWCQHTGGVRQGDSCHG